MNILFYLPFKPVPETGGVQRVTATLASTFAREYGHVCFAAFKYDACGECTQCFEDVRRIGMRDTAAGVVQLVSEWGIDVVVVQGVRSICRQIRCAGLSSSVLLIYVQHSEPGGELKVDGGWLRKIARDVTSGQRPLTLLKDVVHLALWPGEYLTRNCRLRMEYREVHECVDSIIVLAPGYASQYKRLAGIKNSLKLRVIKNPPSFDCLVNEDVLASKENIVLVVARLDERYKRISLVLNVWREVQATGVFGDWNLHIVGEGPDGGYYRLKMKRERVPHVQFLGQIDPRVEYAKASLFLMTSISEGCPLALAEAQQYGVVPIAMNSCAGIEDLIESGNCGTLVCEGDTEGLAEALRMLMANESERTRLAKGCLRESHGRSAVAVAESWNRLFEDYIQGSKQ